MKYLYHLTWIVIASVLFTGNAIAKNPVVDIVIPGPLDGSKVRNPFIEELLYLIFDKNQLTLNLSYFGRHYTQGRALKELSVGGDIDLNWSTTSRERESVLQAIKIPLYKGLIGWRVFLIREEDKGRFAEVTSLDELKKFVAVQRFDWTDYDVFKENGLPVEGNLSFTQHSKAVSSGLADYFPRSVLEVGKEHTLARNSELIIEPNLLIKYPAAYYLFVQKGNDELARVLEHGLEQAMLDGSYMELFNRHFGEYIKALNLSNRTIIELNNSSFPADTGLDKELYWYQ